MSSPVRGESLVKLPPIPVIIEIIRDRFGHLPILMSYIDGIDAQAKRIEAEVVAILEAHHGDQVGIKPWCALCSFPMPCSTHQHAEAALGALRGASPTREAKT